MGNSVDTFVGNTLSDDVLKEDESSRWIGDTPESFKENPNKIFFMISLDEEAAKRTSDVFVHAVAIRRLMKPKTDLDLQQRYIDENCRSCHASFGVFRGRYTCRFCGKNYCSSCLSEKIDDLKACGQCYGSYTSPQSYIKSTEKNKKRKQALSLDTTCLVNYHNQGMFRRARIVALKSDRYTVRYEDGDVESDVLIDRIRTISNKAKSQKKIRDNTDEDIATDLRIGDQVMAQHSYDPTFRNAEIVALLEDGSANVKFDDGSVSFRVKPTRIRKNKNSNVSVVPVVGATNYDFSNFTTAIPTASIVVAPPTPTSTFKMNESVSVNLRGLVCPDACVRIHSAARPGEMEDAIVLQDHGTGVLTVRSLDGSHRQRDVSRKDIFPDERKDRWRAAKIKRFDTAYSTIIVELDTISQVRVGPISSNRVRKRSGSDYSDHDGLDSKQQDDTSSSSKQADLSSSSTTNHQFQGYLAKRSRDGGSYRNRFFQLRYGTLFWYVSLFRLFLLWVCVYENKNTHVSHVFRYNNDAEKFWKGAVYLQGYQIVRISNNRREFRLQPTQNLGRSLDLKARNQQEASIWIQNIRDTIRNCKREQESHQKMRSSSTTVMAPSPPPKILQVNRQQSKAHLFRINRHCWGGWLPSPLLPKLTSASEALNDLIGTRVSILWWRPDPSANTYMTWSGRRRQQNVSTKLRPADKLDPPPEDSVRRWYTGVVRPYDGNQSGTEYLILYVLYTCFFCALPPPTHPPLPIHTHHTHTHTHTDTTTAIEKYTI